LLTAARTNWNLIWTNCKNIHYKVYKPFEKMPPLLSAFASVCFFIITDFIIFWTFMVSCPVYVAYVLSDRKPIYNT